MLSRSGWDEQRRPPKNSDSGASAATCRGHRGDRRMSGVLGHWLRGPNLRREDPPLLGSTVRGAAVRADREARRAR